MRGRAKVRERMDEYDRETCPWSVTGDGSFRCTRPRGHNGLHEVRFGDAEHFASAPSDGGREGLSLGDDGLLPCPFCGGAAREFAWPDHFGCANEGCGAHAANITREQWNRRSPPNESAVEDAGTEAVGGDAGVWPDAHMLEAAWGIIANAGGGDWTTQSDDWREAAERWREAYHRTNQTPVTREAEYPCARCGALRTEAEGGTTFTVCDSCWDATMGGAPSEPSVREARALVAEREARQYADRATALLRDAEADSERLDWLEAQNYHEVGIDVVSTRWSRILVVRGERHHGSTLREAIDAARLTPTSGDEMSESTEGGE